MTKRRTSLSRAPRRAPHKDFTPGWGIYKYNGRESTNRFHWLVNGSQTLCGYFGMGMPERLPGKHQPEKVSRPIAGERDSDECYYCRCALARQNKQAAEQAHLHKNQLTLF